VDLTMKFVQWFTSRGENYEYNMQIIDKHLKDLVSSKSGPRVHTYYFPTNQVEFRPKETEEKFSDMKFE
jgi:hypothetical protein